jgi:acyl carrier protein
MDESDHPGKRALTRRNPIENMGTTSDSLELRVRQIVANTLNLPLDRVPADAHMGSLAEWESMAHLMLVLSLEQEFGQQFSPEEVESMKGIPEIVARLKASSHSPADARID